MKKIDWNIYKFRASAVGNLMKGLPKGLTEKQQAELIRLQSKQSDGKITENQIIKLGQFLEKKNAKPKLSQGAKTYLEKLFKEEYFEKRTEITSKFMDKGNEVEEQSITLFSKVTDTFFVKNKKHFENEYLTGTPDMVKDKVPDIKSSWNLDTFPMFDTELKNDLYYWQVMAYMELTGIHKGEIAYCLVDTPMHLIQDEIRKQSWLNGYIDVPAEFESEIIDSMTFTDIPEIYRVKIFEVVYDKKAVNQMYAMIDLARKYLQGLEIKLKKQEND